MSQDPQHRMSQASNTRCAIYTRKSTSKGLEQLHNSLEAQEDRCKSYISIHDHYSHVQTYSDAGISGGTTERPALKQLLADAKRKKFNMVIVYKIDRLARNQRDFLNIIAELNKHGVELASASEPFDSSTYMGRAMRDLLGVFAEMEREMIRERTLEKAASSRKRGLYVLGLPPMGYRRENGLLQIIESHVPAIKQIYKLYDKGLTTQEIAQRLNTNDMPYINAHGKAKKWSYKEILRVLRQALYAGYVRDGEELHEGQHQAIVDRKLWHKVQEQVEAQANIHRTRTTPKRSIQYPLGKLLTCLQCGKRMKGNYTLKEGKIHRYYDCATRKQYGAEQCDCPSLQADEIERFMLKQLEEISSTPELLAAIIRRMPPELSGYVGDCMLRLDKVMSYASAKEMAHMYGCIYEKIGFDPSEGSINFKFKD